jgi:hypothetical protein
VHRKCIQNVTHLRSECTKYGVVLLVEPLAFKWADPQAKDKFTMDNSVAVTRPLVTFRLHFLFLKTRVPLYSESH